jgi:predicted O-methyltransferase YrrM
MISRLVTHPRWARAKLLGFARAHLPEPSPAAGLSSIESLPLQDVIRRATQADRQAVDFALLDAPRPSLRGPSVLYGTPDASNELVRLVYALCRILRPQLVVETGVAHGFTTAAMLRAMEQNDKGTLISIDLPHLHPRAVESIGLAVEPRLRTRWRLHLGGADQLLPTVLAGHADVDLFVHDAQHSVRGQLAEFHAAWPRISEHGLLVVDDVSAAFQIFHSEVGGDAVLTRRSDEGQAQIGVLARRAVTESVIPIDNAQGVPQRQLDRSRGQAEAHA